VAIFNPFGFREDYAGKDMIPMCRRTTRASGLPPPVKRNPWEE